MVSEASVINNNACRLRTIVQIMSQRTYTDPPFNHSTSHKWGGRWLQRLRDLPGALRDLRGGGREPEGSRYCQSRCSVHEAEVVRPIGRGNKTQRNLQREGLTIWRGKCIGISSGKTSGSYGKLWLLPPPATGSSDTSCSLWLSHLDHASPFLGQSVSHTWVACRHKGQPHVAQWSDGLYSCWVVQGFLNYLAQFYSLSDTAFVLCLHLTPHIQRPEGTWSVATLPVLSKRRNSPLID